MGLLSKLKQDTNSIEVKGEIDSLGGSVIDSDAYAATITLAYHKIADSGANGVIFEFSYADGKTYKSAEYITSGTTKGCKPYWTNQKGENTYLPGYIVAEAISQLTLGQGILDLESEEKIVPIYDYDLKKEVPTPVQVFVELLGKKVTLGITKKTENKSVKGNDGKYVKIAETRDVNEINKVFNEDGLTGTEVTAGLTEPVFLNKWLDKFKGQTVNRVDTSIEASAGGSGKDMKAAIKTNTDIFSDT